MDKRSFSIPFPSSPPVPAPFLLFLFSPYLLFRMLIQGQKNFIFSMKVVPTSLFPSNLCFIYFFQCHNFFSRNTIQIILLLLLLPRLPPPSFPFLLLILLPSFPPPPPPFLKQPLFFCVETNVIICTIRGGGDKSCLNTIIKRIWALRMH